MTSQFLANQQKVGKRARQLDFLLNNKHHEAFQKSQALTRK